MANNRVFLYCPKCNAAAYLAKTMDDGEYYRGTADTDEEAHRLIGSDFLDFFEKHFWCGPAPSARHIELRFEHAGGSDRGVPLDAKFTIVERSDREQ